MHQENNDSVRSFHAVVAKANKRYIDGTFDLDETTDEGKPA